MKKVSLLCLVFLQPLSLRAQSSPLLEYLPVTEARQANSKEMKCGKYFVVKDMPGDWKAVVAEFKQATFEIGGERHVHTGKFWMEKDSALHVFVAPVNGPPKVAGSYSETVGWRFRLYISFKDYLEAMPCLPKPRAILSLAKYQTI